ncbi:MAG: xanthine dehydrogenase family protein subunit M [Hyphomicrobiaceae bacterium]
MYAFDIVRPGSVAEAAKALTGDAKVLAGGHTLLPTLKQRLANPGKLVDISGISELRGIKREGSNLVIGALTRHAEVAGSPEVKSAIPALAYLAGHIGDPQVRNAGTIGGSVANNDPAADYPSAVLALGATIVTNKREIAADGYFTGLFSTALGADEIITQIRFPVPGKAGYAKFGQPASRYALVGVFVAKTASGVGAVRVAVTGAGANGVFRADAIEKALAISFAADAAKGVKVADGGLISDIHGSAAYRAALIPVMAAQAVAHAA